MNTPDTKPELTKGQLYGILLFWAFGAFFVGGPIIGILCLPVLSVLALICWIA